jgi:hypothetical protein
MCPADAGKQLNYPFPGIGQRLDLSHPEPILTYPKSLLLVACGRLFFFGIFHIFAGLKIFDLNKDNQVYKVCQIGKTPGIFAS